MVGSGGGSSTGGATTYRLPENMLPLFPRRSCSQFCCIWMNVGGRGGGRGGVGGKLKLKMERGGRGGRLIGIFGSGMQIGGWGGGRGGRGGSGGMK